MSMLSEPKKKKKWNINPRGTLWTNDENKFGQKLMEKMGWSKGKGLGKEGQGCQEPIRVSMNQEQRGVGFKETSDLEWTKHFDAFENVLSNLNSMNNPDVSNEDCSVKVESLEEKSKGSRSRVHYHKFTRGKDLSRYNEDDLACILGSKRMKQNNVEKEIVSQKSICLDSNNLEEETEVGYMDKSHGLTTVHGGNLKDYFAQKMKEIKEKRGEGIIGCEETKNVDNLNDSMPNFDFEPEKMSFSFNVSNCIPESGEDSKRRLKKQKNVNSCIEETSIKDSQYEVEVKKKKKVKTKQKNVSEIIEEEKNKDINELKRKEKKKKKEKPVPLIETCEVEDLQINLSQKVKKRKRSKENFEEEEVSPQLSCSRKEKSKKKKINSFQNNDTENKLIELNADEEREIISPFTDKYNDNNKTDEISLQKKKKRDRQQKLVCSISDIEYNSVCDDSKITKENEVNRVLEALNDSYCHAITKKKKTKEIHINEAPLKKIKKLASELNIADLFKSSSSLVPIGNLSEHDIKLPEKKVKLSAKKSFKELKNGVEAKLKLIKRKQDLGSLDKIVENKAKTVSNNKRSEEAHESEIEVPVPQPKKLNLPSVPADVNLGTLFPGSNLLEINGYDM